MKSELKAIIKAELIKEASEDKKNTVGWGDAAATYIPGAIAARIPGVGILAGPLAQHGAINISRHIQGKEQHKPWLGTAWNTGVGETLGLGLGAAVSAPIISNTSNALTRAIEKKFGPEAAAAAAHSPEFFNAVKRRVLPMVAPIVIGTTLTGGYLAHHAARNAGEK